MCGGGPKINQTDPTAQRLKAEQDAADAANAKLVADRRRKRSADNLLVANLKGADTLGGTQKQQDTAGTTSTVLGGFGGFQTRYSPYRGNGTTGPLPTTGTGGGTLGGGGGGRPVRGASRA